MTTATFPKASAVKRGRNPRFPYVAVVVCAGGRTHNTNARTAFATRDEAVAYAAKWIEASEAAKARSDAAWAARRQEIV